MKRREEGRVAEEIRRRLRAGDPAGDGRDLSPEEAAAMRRAVLAAVPEREAPRVGWLWKPVMAAAVLFAVSAVVVWVYWPGPVVTSMVVEGTPEVVEVAERLPEVAPAIEESEPQPEPVKMAVVVEPAPKRTAPPKVVPAAVPKQARNIRFTTANGTQIIWKLDPDYQPVATGS